MNVAAVQFKGSRSDHPGSLQRLRELAREAAVGADLVVLPELAATQYLFADAAAARLHAEPADGPTLAALGPVAAEAGCWLVVGFPEVEGDALFNSALVIDPRGALQFTYRKTLLFDCDWTWARPGDSGYRAFDTDAGRFTPGICMDLNDDEFVNWCAGSGARTIALATNWILDPTGDTWRYWAWRVEPTGAALVAANTYGCEGEVHFCGRSLVLDQRVVLAAAPETGDAVVTATLPPRSTSP